MSPPQAQCATIDLWLASLDGGDISALTRCLAPDELARAHRFVNTSAAQQYVTARATLRQILGSYLDRDPRDVQLEYGQFGKPALAGEFGLAEGRPGKLHFNLSHAADRAVYALCATAEVGIDIELDDGRINPAELAHTICSARELQQFQAYPLVEQRELFFRLWTRKEAYLKCLGNGLSMEPGSLEMSMADVAEVFAGAGTLRCSVRTLKLAAGVQVSVATRSKGSQVHNFRSWPSQSPIL